MAHLVMQMLISACDWLINLQCKIVPSRRSGCLMAKLWVNWVFSIFKAGRGARLCSCGVLCGRPRFNDLFCGSREVNALKLTVIELLTGSFRPVKRKKKIKPRQTYNAAFLLSDCYYPASVLCLPPRHILNSSRQRSPHPARLPCPDLWSSPWEVI